MARDIKVTMLVEADEFLSLRSMVEDDGLSDSGFMRMLFKKEARRRALEKLSERSALEDSAEPAHVLNTKVRAV